MTLCMCPACRDRTNDTLCVLGRCRNTKTMTLCMCTACRDRTNDNPLRVMALSLALCASARAMRTVPPTAIASSAAGHDDRFRWLGPAVGDALSTGSLLGTGADALCFFSRLFTTTQEVKHPSASVCWRPTARHPSLRESARTSCSSGRALAELSGRRQLEERVRRAGMRLPGAQTGTGPQLCWDCGGPVSREEAQELHSFGAEPAADLQADNNQAAAPRALELWICLVPLAPGGGRDGGPWLDVCAGGATEEPGTARCGWRARRAWEGHSRHGRQRARPAIAAALETQVYGQEGASRRRASRRHRQEIAAIL